MGGKVRQLPFCSNFLHAGWCKKDGHVSFFALQTSKIIARPLLSVSPQSCKTCSSVWPLNWLDHKRAQIMMHSWSQDMQKGTEKKNVEKGSKGKLWSWAHLCLSWLARVTSVFYQIHWGLLQHPFKSSYALLTFFSFARCLGEIKVLQNHPQPGLAFSCVFIKPDETMCGGCHTSLFCKRKQKSSVTNYSSYILWQRREAILFRHWTHLDSSHANAIIQKFLNSGVQCTAIAYGSVPSVVFSLNWWQRCRVSPRKQKAGSGLSIQ